MQERDIFCDVLSGTKHSINCYTNAIMETSDQQLRSTWQTLRNEAEQMQYQIYQMAEQKGYYTPAPKANPQDCQSIKSTLTSAVNSANTSKSSSSSNIYSAGMGGSNTQQSSPAMSMSSSTSQNPSNSMNRDRSSSTKTMFNSSNQQQFSNSTNNNSKTSKQSKNNMK